MASHPSDDRLRSFSLGTADPDDAKEIAAHLESCPECCARVEDATHEDGFVIRLRSVANKSESAETSILRITPNARSEPVPAVSTPATGFPTTLGGYRIERLLGGGGMGSVYLAHDLRLGRAVALKTMRPEIAARPGAVERFLREARSAARVEHDNIVPIWQVGEENGIPFIAMPLLRGESLADRLAREPVSPSELINQVGREVAEGLAAAHQKGLLHRDIKPANVWLEGDPDSPDPAARVRRCKILDFGLARPADETQLTAEGLMVGSPGYMSPEQARARPLDHRTDLFSLGAVLYRMMTGLMPFDGPSVTSILTSLAVDEPPPLPVAPGGKPGLSDLVMRLLAKNPANRPPSARAVADELSALGESAARRGSGRWSRRRVAALAAAVALVVIGVIVITVRGPAGKDTPITTLAGNTANGDPPKDSKTTPTPTVSADRRAAEWVLDCGGALVVKVGEATWWVRSPTQPPNRRWPMAETKLPDDAFSVTVIDLSTGGERVTDAGLEHLAGLKELVHLDLSGTNVTDAGMTRVGATTGLVAVRLEGTSITDDGLFRLRRLTALRFLDLGRTRVTDTGLIHIQVMSQLRDLRLPHTAVTGTGLASLRGLAGLTLLFLNNSPAVSDEGLAHLRDLPHLAHLDLHGTGVTDDGLKHLGGLSKLAYLNLSVTRVTDGGLRHLMGLPELQELHLYSTAITGPGLEHLAGVPRLARLFLSRTRVTDSGLEFLKGLTGLTHLNLYGDKVTDAGLEHLKALTNLTHLNLSETQVTSGCVVGLQVLPKLRYCVLHRTQLTPEAVEQLRKAVPSISIVVETPDW